jgi:molybdate/tungstate transport system permease protein
MSLRRGRVLTVVAMLSAYTAGYAIQSHRGSLVPFEPFNLIMFGTMLAIAMVLLTQRGYLLLGVGMMALVVGHTFVGQHLAPDSLTSGAMLLVNLLVLYVGFKLFTCAERPIFIVFIVSYLGLFVLFQLWQDNSEPLFLLALMGLAGCGRSLRLMAYFWVLVASFTICQPYSWESVVLGFAILTAIFSARGTLRSGMAVWFLGIGLALVALVLLPVVILLFGQDLHNVELMLRDPRVRSAIGLTFWTASVSTLILAAFGLPLAYGLSRLRFRGRTLVLSCLDIPIVIPQSVAGIVLISLLGRQQFVGGWVFRTFGISVDGTTVGIIIAQVFVAMPFFVKSALSAFDAVPESIEQTARTLGASPAGSFRRVALPLASRGIMLGAVLAWARAAGEFGAVVILAPTPETAPVAAFNRFNAVGSAETAPLVAVLLLFSIAMFVLLQLLSRLLPASYGGQRA